MAPINRLMKITCKKAPIPPESRIEEGGPLVYQLAAGWSACSHTSSTPFTLDSEAAMQKLQDALVHLQAMDCPRHHWDRRRALQLPN